MKKLLFLFVVIVSFYACKNKKAKTVLVTASEKKFSKVEEVTAAVSALLPAPSSFELKSAKKWHDASGENWLVLYESDPYIKKGSTGATAKLSAMLYQKTDSGFVQKWKIVDGVADCEVDVTCSYYNDHLTITDLDSNDIAEITMVYALSCKGDVSPNEKKLIMYEGEKMYAIRGEELMILQKDTVGGQYLADKSFDNAPPVFINYARKHWQKFGKQAYQ